MTRIPYGSDTHQPLAFGSTRNWISLPRDNLRQWFDERGLIPPGNLVEVRFEDPERGPLAELRRVYEGLRLPGFAAAEPAFRAAIAAGATYRKNAYILDDTVVEQVNRHWHFALQEWDYPVLLPREAMMPSALR